MINKKEIDYIINLFDIKEKEEIDFTYIGKDIKFFIEGLKNINKCELSKFIKRKTKKATNFEFNSFLIYYLVDCNKNRKSSKYEPCSTSVSKKEGFFEKIFGIMKKSNFVKWVLSPMKLNKLNKLTLFLKVYDQTF